MSAGRVPLCRVDELAPGAMRRVPRPDGPPLAVYNVDGEIFATDDTCTHSRASLTEGDLEGHEVVCPVHMGAFDVRSGAPLCFPVDRPLRTYAVAIEDGLVWALDTESARS